MSDSFQKTYEEQLLLLPEVNRRALGSIDWMSKVIEIGKKRGLHIDQIDDLRVEVMLVLVGAMPAAEFQNTVTVELAVSPTEAGKITEEINKQIFSPIHDYILKHGAGEKPQPITPHEETPVEPTLPPKPATPLPTEPIQESAPEEPLAKTGIVIEEPPQEKEEAVPDMSPQTFKRVGIATAFESAPQDEPEESVSTKDVGISLDKILSTGDETTPPPITKPEPVFDDTPVPHDDRKEAALDKLRSLLRR